MKCGRGVGRPERVGCSGVEVLGRENGLKEHKLQRECDGPIKPVAAKIRERSISVNGRTQNARGLVLDK